MATKKTRSDMLRRRPNSIRYFGIVVTDNGISHWTSHGALHYLVKKGLKITALYVSDVVTGVCFLWPASVAVFMAAWEAHYNDPAWDAKKWVDNLVETE